MDVYRPTKPEGAWVEIPFEVTRKEPRRLLLNMTRSYDFGTYQATLNGVRIGEPMDLYHDTTDNREYHLLDFWPDPGKYVLRLECVGQNARSTARWLGIESVRLRERRGRVARWAHDRNKNWRTKPLLYR